MSVLVMQPVQTRSGFLQKQIPTLVGVVVLVIAMVAGLFMFSEGTGVFAPRATPQTTPKQVKITNIADKAFTISFYTDEATAGFVKYGTTDADLSSQASDDRDQLSGTVGKYSLHHVTLKGLKPNTQYFFTLGTGSGVVYDNNGSPFTVKTTAEVSGPPPVANTIYGTVTNAGGTAAEGSVVYLAIDGVNELSALVKSSGSWAIPLANARMKADGGYANLKDDATLNIFVQGVQLSQTTQTVVALKDAQPVADLALGSVGQQVAQLSAGSTNQTQTASQAAEPMSNQEASASTGADQDAAANPQSQQLAADLNSVGQGGNETASSDSSQATDQSALTPTPPTQSVSPTQAPQVAESQSTPANSTASAVLNLSEVGVGGTAVTVQAPKIVGQAPPRTQVKIEVHSDTQITETITTTDGGNFELDLAQYQNLEPGEHSVTITYTDPQTSQEVTQTRTFIVEDTRQIALGQGGNTPPYGSGNPYPVTSPTPTPTTEPTPTVASDSTDTSTRSAVVSTTSGTYKSGSVGVTFALIGGGLFFILTGLWSWWLAGLVREETA